LQKGEQIAAVQQNMEAKQQMITQQIAELERRLQDKDQQLTTYDPKNEKQLEMKQREEVSRQVAEVDKKVQAAKTQLQQGCNQTVVEISGLKQGIEQVETSLEEEQGQMKELNGKLEESNEAVGKKLQEHQLELIGQFRRPASSSFSVTHSDVPNCAKKPCKDTSCSNISGREAAKHSPTTSERTCSG